MRGTLIDVRLDMTTLRKLAFNLSSNTAGRVSLQVIGTAWSAWRQATENKMTHGESLDDRLTEHMSFNAKDSWKTLRHSVHGEDCQEKVTGCRFQQLTSSRNPGYYEYSCTITEKPSSIYLPSRVDLLPCLCLFHLDDFHLMF